MKGERKINLPQEIYILNSEIFFLSLTFKRKIENFLSKLFTQVPSAELEDNKTVALFLLELDLLAFFKGDTVALSGGGREDNEAHQTIDTN